MGVFTPGEFKPEGECEVVGCFGGYIYINMSVTRVMAVRIPGLSVAAIDAAFFGDYPNIPPYRADPRDQNPERTAQVSRWLESLFVGDPKSQTDHDGREVATAVRQRPRFTVMSDVDLLAHYRSLRTVNRQIFKRHVLNTYGANVLSSLIAQVAQSVGAGNLTPKITAAIGDVTSARQSLDLWDLSREIRESVAMSAEFDRGIDGLLPRLRHSTDPDVRSFLARWDNFIDRWGFLGPSIWEFRSPTYRTNPEIALRMLGRLRHAPDTSAPNVRAASLAAQRGAAIADIAARTTANPQLQAQFIAAARAAAQFLAAREASKQWCAQLVDEIRSPLRELGQRLVERALLPRWEHLLLVTNDEIDACVADPGKHRGLIAERASQLELLLAKEPPFVFEGEPPPLSAFAERSAHAGDIAGTGEQLTGIGVSPGLYTGRARVVASLHEESKLEPGEIIVAVTTDASWGPLFLTAGAVIVETGAAISHAAIVARELGIPAAVSVVNATHRIRNGTLVTVDGSSGTVTVH